MICPVCHTNNEGNENFCLGCGRKIPKCPTCGNVLTSRDRYCLNDGTRIPEDILLLVPEETVLQPPVWSRTANTEMPAPEPTPEIPEENTLRAATTPLETPPIYEDWNWEDPTLTVPQSPPAPPQRRNAYCEGCGKRVPPGTRLCSECSGKAAPRREKNRLPLILVLVVLLVLALFGAGYAIAHSDLFDWADSHSSTQQKKDDDEDPDADGDVDADEGADQDANEDSTTLPEAATDATTEPATEAPTEATTEPPTEVPTAAPEPDIPDSLAYFINNCDKKYLKESDLAGFDAQMCVYARNACYAKSGRKFNSSDLQEFFEQFDWYEPQYAPGDFKESMLNTCQTANVKLVLAYERAHGWE